MNELDKWIGQLFQCKKLSIRDIKCLCRKATEILIDEDNVVEIDGPVIVCGDIHGQFDDLKNLFDKGGCIPDKKYLFLGDYVDRGQYSVETISLLVALKIRYPKLITLLRGNHESRLLTNVYGFYDECMRKYRTTFIWKCFNNLFDFFPICALIDNKIIAMHGGLSPFIKTIDKIRTFNRINEPTNKQFCDLLWSDPMKNSSGWHFSPRGLGYLFGENVTSEFVHTNSLKCITRAHQVMMQGYEWCHSQKLVTVFSASNYCNNHNNCAAILKIDYPTIDFVQYKTKDELFEKNKQNDKNDKKDKKGKRNKNDKKYKNAKTDNDNN